MMYECTKCGMTMKGDAAPVGVTVACPTCGNPMRRQAASPPVRSVGTRPMTAAEARRDRRSANKVFEPIPGAFAYGVGIILVLLILAPFWLEWFMGKLERPPVIVSDDAGNLQVSPSANTNAVEPIMTAPARSEFSRDTYRGLRLDGSRTDLQEKLLLRLQNSPGMLPEIYSASNVENIEHVTAHFYQNRLKEFFVILKEQRVVPSVLEKQLNDEFGQPHERLETRGGAGVGGVTPLPGASTAGGAMGDMAKKLESFARSRFLVWFDDRNRIEATIYYTSLDPDQCISVLAVHVSAAAWLAANRSSLGLISAPQPPPLPETGTTTKQLFP